MKKASWIPIHTVWLHLYECKNINYKSFIDILLIVIYNKRQSMNGHAVDQLQDRVTLGNTAGWGVSGACNIF